MLKIHLIFVAKIIWIIMGYTTMTLKIVIVSILDALKVISITLFVVALFSLAFTDIENLKIIASAPIDEWQIVLQGVLKAFLSVTVIFAFLFQVLEWKYVGDFQLSEVWKEYLNNKKQYQNT
ncbi:hypothetical protein [Photobacterium damselae]|uniref:hypothetical protein n=1 Tax=Photobacterium damselae TaxID=38293 RepID=UPI0010FD608F|nr:hypothetical protein [Photobacterium damselae]KAB1512013.1 hypothetical protein FD717_010545 [Photobacterium damselae subsp. damselae]TLS72285.1 hypothetical protein FD718_02855 [Photobacterium damselae subsp. damselae]TLS80261.1 hypothetical protein FD721_01665 [Photobacterium damselae subsp. damselae]TLS82902.1 hypothetical protein FD720_21105 [Photobacterium damselae subsp. damselae]